MYSRAKQGIKPDDKLSVVIFHNPYVLLMLEHFGVRMPVHEKTVKQVCDKYSIGPNVFITVTNLYNGIRPSGQPAFGNDDIIDIISFLKNSHNYYLNEKYPIIRDFIEQVQKKNNSKEIGLVEKFFGEYFKKVQNHINYENDVAFPYIVTLIENGQQPLENGYSIVHYEEKHDNIEEELTDLKNLLIKYLPQENDQTIRRKLIFALFELEFDLTIHAQIEDLILLPVIKKLEGTAQK